MLILVCEKCGGTDITAKELKFDPIYQVSGNGDRKMIGCRIVSGTVICNDKKCANIKQNWE